MEHSTKAMPTHYQHVALFASNHLISWGIMCNINVIGYLRECLYLFICTLWSNKLFELWIELHMRLIPTPHINLQCLLSLTCIIYGEFNILCARIMTKNDSSTQKAINGVNSVIKFKVDTPSPQWKTHCLYLTYQGRDKMANNLEMAYLNSFCYMTVVVFWFQFQWNMFPRAQLTISQHWFKEKLAIE